MKKTMALTMAIALSASLTACGSGDSAKPVETTSATAKQETEVSKEEKAESSTEQVSVKFGNTQSETDLQSQSLTAVAEKLAKATDGNFKAETFFSSSLGDTDDLLEQGMQGAAVLTVTDPSRLASFVPDFGILGMPYIMDDYTGLNKVMQTDLYDEWMQQFADQGIWVVTSNWYSGARNFCLNKKVNKPEDLQGQRIRTIGNEICTTAVNAMGAVATPMSWSEVYTSIQQGALDGAEVQTSSFYATRLWEVVNTLNRTEHFQLIGCAATGTGFRDSLSADYQKLFADTFYEVGTEFQEKTVEICADWEKEMAEKYNLVINEDVDVQAFKDAAAPCYETLGMVEIRDRLQSEMANVK